MTRRVRTGRDGKSSESSASELGAYLFTLAIIADTHLNQEEYGSTSPYECNRVANGRTRHVVQQLNRFRPRLVIHLGDLVHPVPALPSYGQAARNFQELTKELRCKLYLVPGNHDVGDKPVAWAPAGTVNDAYLGLWRQYFSDHYYAFDFRGLHFVVLDAQIINSGLDCEAEQRRWLEGELATHANQRTFLCLHYPPYLTDPEESESYDNLGEPGRSWLLRLVETYRPEAMFCGHVHNFWYNRHGTTECYVLPSTAFVRHDYSELYRAEPGDPEHGRNDLPKLGYFLVRIYERGHVCHVVRTYGATVEPGQTLAPGVEGVPSLHTKENHRAPLGLDLRQPWAEIVEIPPSGAVDEFGRKKARNDYPVMALWEMGIRKLRVPVQDVEDLRIRERMRVLRSLGHQFTVYTFGVPEGPRRDILVEHHDVVDVWEVVCDWPEVRRTVEAIREVKAKAPLTAYLSRLRSKDHAPADGSRYYHAIDHGFLSTERGVIEGLLRAEDTASVIDGFVCRVARQASPWVEIAAAGAIASELRTGCAVHVRMASGNPAESFKDDLDNANRVAEALVAAMAQSAPGQPGVDVFIDTFADVDRGYFVRNGLVDRRYNPRLGSHVVRHLYGALSASPHALTPGELRGVGFGRLCTLERSEELLALVMPERQILVERVPAGKTFPGTAGTARRIDLETGHVQHWPWRRSGDELELTPGIACARPTLIAFALGGRG
ncbi:MAG: metallophosphoesterase [Candidatus Rokubacteria bacterium]|nr:metallophosphoesterase [Candidatus Rokubacteria bacterium]